jgi:hypothetical protein
MKTTGVVAFLLAGGLFAATALAETKEIKGAAILKHPIGVLALKQVKLVKAGKLDEVYALRTASERADWKSASARDKKEFAEWMPQRAPEYAAFETAIRKNGLLKIEDDRAQLHTDLGSAGTAIAFYELEGGQWRGSSGPVVIAPETDPANEERINGAEILDHPIGALAVQYVTHVQAGQMDKAVALASNKVQAEWKTLPADEKKESAAFLKKMLPAAKSVRSSIESGGLLIIEDKTRATLNVISTTQTSTEPGVVSSSSTTSAIPFVFEDGKWKIAR